jgi:hypothetical protein
MSENPPRTYNPGAAILGWLLPGLGHISLGHTRRGLLIMAGTLYLFLAGILVGGIDVVDRRDDRLWFYAQAGCGPIAFVADFANQSLLKTGRVGRLVSPTGVVTPVPGPGGVITLGPGVVNEYTGIAHVNEFGTLFCGLAGLLNIAVVLDALSRPRRQPEFVDRRKGA